MGMWVHTCPILGVCLHVCLRFLGCLPSLGGLWFLAWSTRGFLPDCCALGCRHLLMGRVDHLGGL